MAGSRPWPAVVPFKLAAAAVPVAVALSAQTCCSTGRPHMHAATCLHSTLQQQQQAQAQRVSVSAAHWCRSRTSCKKGCPDMCCVGMVTRTHTPASSFCVHIPASKYTELATLAGQPLSPGIPPCAAASSAASSSSLANSDRSFTRLPYSTPSAVTWRGTGLLAFRTAGNTQHTTIRA